MRKAMGLIFDEWIMGGPGGTAAGYSSCELDGFLSLCDQLALQFNIYNPNATAASVTLALHHSADEEHWVTRLFTNQTVGAHSMLPVALLDSGQTPLLPFARVAIAVSSAVPVQVEVWMTQRDAAINYAAACTGPGIDAFLPQLTKVDCIQRCTEAGNAVAYCVDQCGSSCFHACTVNDGHSAKNCTAYCQCWDDNLVCGPKSCHQSLRADGKPSVDCATAAGIPGYKGNLFPNSQ